MEAAAAYVSVPSPGWAGEADYCSRDGAEVLKDRIEAYWRERGMSVTVALANVGFHPAIRAARYEIRSDMVNGLPRNQKALQRGGAANIVHAVDGDEDDNDLD